MLGVVNGEGAGIEDVEDFIGALADSNLIMGMLEENGIVIEIDEALEGEITTFIETEFAGNQDLINQLKSILNLL